MITSKPSKKAFQSAELTFPLYLVFDGFHAVNAADFTVGTEVVRSFSQHVQLPLVLNVCLTRRIYNYVQHLTFTVVVIVVVITS